jgi:signal transduction histidine kinase/CheY-like chemotaxis protein
MRVRALIFLVVALAALYAASLILFVTPRLDAWDLLIWLALGAILIVIVLSLLRRRFWSPLARLEEALVRLASGDLDAQLPVEHPDELGRLSAHFNEMARVLRDRAEENGRFAAGGELLAGVAHEVNNPLMAIAALAEMRMDDPGLPEPQREEMREILGQARRASKLLRGLLRFVRASERHISRIDLNDVVRGALDLVSYRFSVDEIQLGGRLDPLLPVVQGDPIRLEQVLVNLLSNAIDAMRAVPAPRRLVVDTWVEDEAVFVAVQDSGRGVPAELAKRLFLPFATTKGRRGTGLGLYVSRQLIRESGGELSLVSNPGEGARFVFHLPAAPAEPAASPRPAARLPSPQARVASPAPPSAATAPAPATSGIVDSTAGGTLEGIRVLLVDDEEVIRRPLARFLERRGAKVVEAADGEEALATIERVEPDVILADLRMPRLGGAELHDHLRRSRPALAERVLFLSGDLSQLDDAGAHGVTPARVLAKPVELRELEKRLVEFLGNRPKC